MLVGKFNEKRLIERPRCRWENNFIIDVREKSCGM
jgi:hypothetical protein